MNQQARSYYRKIAFPYFSLFIILITTVHCPLAQQRLFTNQQHFTVEDGLPQNFIGSILQDDDGFIWLATMDGLCRYDGRVFKTFHYNAKDSNSLASNTINNFSRFHNNNITVHYTSTEADNFNLRTFKASRNITPKLLSKIPFAHYKPYHVAYSTDNWLFIMENRKGIGWMNSNTRQVFYANKANGLLQQDTICAAIESREGKLYLVSEDGVHLSNSAKNKFQWIPFTTNVKKETYYPDGTSDRFTIVTLPNDRLLVAEADKVILLDVNKRTTRFIEPPAGLKLVNLNCEAQVDAQGRAFFENGGRIFRIEKNDEMKLLWENTINPSLRISGFFIDRSEVLWLSINAQGLLKIDLRSAAFETFTYRKNFIADILEQAGLQLKMPLAELTRSEASYTLRQAFDTKGNHYLHSGWLVNGDVYRIQANQLPVDFKAPKGFDYAGITPMPGNDLWAVGQQNFVWYFWKKSSPVGEKLAIDYEKLGQVEISDAKYAGGSVWLTTTKHGLLQYDVNKKISYHAGNLKNGKMPETLTEICIDPADSNLLWIGSRGGGLILWHAQNGLQKIYTTDDGLPNNTIYCILPDKFGKIWCSTNKGIFRLNKITGQITAFEKTDGLQGNEFNRAHKFRFADGRLAFGGLDGYTIFDPSKFPEIAKPLPVPLMLTGFQVNNKPQGIEFNNSFIKESFSNLASIDLPYYRNNLRFEFAAMLFNQQQKTKYRYMLEGADEDWIENGTSNIAAYTALAPGNYTLLINASDITGQWSSLVKKIKVNIRPPFWATWWAKLIYIILAIALIRWYFKFREQQLKARQDLAFEKREAHRLKELDEMKDRFFSNITHEFRTPLTLIMTPLEKLEKDNSLSPAATAAVKTAQRNSTQLLKLINEFLDFSKLNEGQLKPRLSAGELDLFVKDLVKTFEPAAREKNIELQLSLQGIGGLYMFDEDKWEKILGNLLSNALKFTPTGGLVTVSLTQLAAENVLMEVKDTGTGIPHDQQEKIFNRFYQVDDSAIRNYGGTGIGLALVKELTELMQGSISLESIPNKYTLFSLTFPVKKANGVITKNVSEAPAPVAKILSGQDLPLVLIVEDNAELRSFLVETMRNHYRVLEAANGLQAAEIILAELPDLVISDVMMPGMDGFDLCQQTKHDPRTAHIGFILLTSKAAHDARLTGLEKGADEYISKPFNLQELELRASNILQFQKTQRDWLQSQLVNSTPQAPLPVITDPFLVQLYQEMDAKLDDAELGVDDLSRAMAMSRSTLNRKLKSLLDISAKELLRQHRLQKAASLLSSGMDISTVAYQVGFTSPSYFTQCFREKYGITPSEHALKQN